MIRIKTKPEIEIMQRGGKILSEVLTIIFEKLKPGVSLSELDKLAEQEIIKRGALPSFKKVKGYFWTICGCVNDVVVHGIPNSYIIKKGDVVGIDCGVYYKGFHTDAAWTKRVQDESRIQNDEIDKFLKVGEGTLKKALEKICPGSYIYDISSTIADNVEAGGYFVVRSLVGHGVGRKLHEEPEIPGVVTLSRFKTPQIREGMTLAVEVIYNMGTPDIVYGEDGWTIKTKDGKLSGLFEATVVATNHGSLVLTKKTWVD